MAEAGGLCWRKSAHLSALKNRMTNKAYGGERLQLLAVVRGLESLGQPSRITLVTSSKYVGRGIRRGLTQWRQNDWQWERFGQMSLIKNHDYWKRIDHSLKIHQVNCRIWQFDPPHVRTQVSNVAESAELCQPKSLFVSPAMETPKLRTSNKIRPDFEKSRLNLNQQKRSLKNFAQNASANVLSLADKVRPIGVGKAYGYAVN